MASLNKVMMIGNLGADSEQHYEANRSAATNRPRPHESWMLRL